MKIYHEFLPYKVTDVPCVFSMGTFDGVHLGHKLLFHEVIERAKKKKIKSVLCFFSNHPLQILNPAKAPLILTTPEKKVELIKAFPFDILLALTFSEKIANLTREQFLKALLTMVPIEEWVVGGEISFGRGALGNKEFLLQQKDTFSVTVLDRFSFEGSPISSSRIRKLIEAGLVTEAEKLLGTI